MNPLNLLTKGQTLKGLGRPGRYKFLPQCAPPNFQAPKRRAATAVPAVPEQKQATLFEPPSPALAAPVVPRSVPVAAPVIPPAAMTMDSPVEIAPLVPEPVPTVEPEPGIPNSPFAEKAIAGPKMANRLQRAGRAIKDWAQRLIFGYKRPAQPAASLQTELALDKVTVMRNNLNEDDLEVVLVQRKVGTGGRPLARVRRMEMTGEAWTKLTAPFRKKNNGNANAFSPGPEKSGGGSGRARFGG